MISRDVINRIFTWRSFKKIKLLRFLLLLGFLVNSTFALAQRVYDNAGGDNEWRNSANWQNGNFVNTDS